MRTSEGKIADMVRLVIPGPPPLSLNQQERLHWAKRRRLREWWAQQARYAWIEAGRPKFERAMVRYRLYYPTNRKRDGDNCVASCKPILDGLKGHAFPDDDAGTVTILPPVIAVDKYNARVEIEITEAAEVRRHTNDAREWLN